MEALLSALPVLVKWLPALAKVVGDLIDGTEHPDLAAWCAHVPGLADVAAAIRDEDANTLAAVRRIMGTNDELRDALAQLARKTSR